jgi:hypothetical protein
MGYRALLKRYIRHLELVAGDSYIEAPAREPVLTLRDLGELRTLSAEVSRDAFQASDVSTIENYNHRLRVLMNRYALTVKQVGEMCGVEPDQARCWRTNPRSDRYRAMTEAEFATFEQALARWLEN